MKLIIKHIQIGFKRNTVYRINYLMGIIGTFIQLFITVAIWKALYGPHVEINGISFGMLTTNFIISIGLQHAFSFNDFAVQSKVNDGSIAVEFVRPVDYRVSLLASELGEIAFKLITNFIPIVIVGILLFGIEMPQSIAHFALFLCSVVLGFLILWSLSMIVKMSTFWVMNVWSLSVLKGVLISVFSGITLPIWFLPQNVVNLLRFTPFESIYFSSLQIYLGRIAGNEIGLVLLKQLLWGVALFMVANLMWAMGRKRLIVQGG